jgi:choline-sulfatase
MFEAEKMQISPTWGKADLKSLPNEVRRWIENCPSTPELKEASGARERMAYYYGSLAQMDDCAGQVLGALTRLGLDRNTIVVYTADHGEMLGDLGLWNKFQFYEGSCGVPLTIRMPGYAPALCHQPLSLVSLRATLADLCQVPMLKPGDGASFADLVRHPDSQVNHGPVFAEYNNGNPAAKYMMRDGDLKYTFWVHDIEELYDLRADPQEMRNLAQLSEHRLTVERLKRELFAWHRPAEL